MDNILKYLFFLTFLKTEVTFIILICRYRYHKICSIQDSVYDQLNMTHDPLYNNKAGIAWLLTLVLLNPDMPCLCKQCRSRSVGFWSHLIWICTVCHLVFEFVSITQIKTLTDWLKIKSRCDILTLLLLNTDMPCLSKQCRSRSVGFWRSQLIWVCNVCH